MGGQVIQADSATEADPRKPVAIGLPVYNGENFISEAIDSILAQTFTDFELVIGDNASTDATQEICREYAARDERIRYFRHERNLGAAPNYNFTFSKASSTYFRWAAHDDLCCPEYLELAVEALEARPEAVLAFPRSVIIDDEGEALEECAADAGFASSRFDERVRATLMAERVDEPIFALMRSQAIRRTRLHGSYTGSDRVLLVELALEGDFIEIPRTLFEFREHEQRSTRAFVGEGGHPREAWFDTSRAGKITFPNWKRVEQYATGILRAPVSTRVKMRCLRMLCQWLGDRNWKRLVRDLAVAVQSIGPRFSRGGSGSDSPSFGKNGACSGSSSDT